MGLHDEFNKAIDYIKFNVSFDADINVSVFETNIRVVGGLLSAHMLSHRYDIFFLNVISISILILYYIIITICNYQLLGSYNKYCSLCLEPQQN